MALLKEIYYEDIPFDVGASQQFATVIFDREEDASTCLITVLKDRKINQFEGHDKYNPSRRRVATCTYVNEEEVEGQDARVIKVCTIQHKGSTLIEVHSVDQEELDYLFGK